MKNTTHQGAALALTQLLRAIENGEDGSGGIRRFLRLWAAGKSLEEYTIDPNTPARTGLMLVGLYAYVANSEAVVRPMSFGKHKEVAAAIGVH